MKKLRLGKRQVEIGQLMKGSDYFRLDNPEVVSENLDLFVQAGGNAIDTAHIYCGGESEMAIGRWLEERNNREEIVILTKGAHHNQDGPQVKPEVITEQLNISLDRLRTSYVDMYALHRDDPTVSVGPIMECLNDHLETGKIKAIGVSNWTHERIQEANEYASSHGLEGFSFNSPNLSLAKANEPFWEGCVSADEETLKWHTEHQFPLLSWSSQARGFFTGRYTPENRENEDLVRVFYSDDNWERLRRAGELAEMKNVTVIQIALAYVLNQSFPTCAIVGPRNEQEMKSCFESVEISLSQEEMSWLDLTE